MLRAQSTGHRARSTGHRAQGAGHGAQSTEHRAQGTGHRAQVQSTGKEWLGACGQMRGEYEREYGRMGEKERRRAKVVSDGSPPLERWVLVKTISN
ncbi:MAG: hypothetical protein IPI69_09610 [Bacteroidales bacterium]|nr:hypothetical protein [Bacteroidales bacterium]